MTVIHQTTYLVMVNDIVSGNNISNVNIIVWRKRIAAQTGMASAWR